MHYVIIAVLAVLVLVCVIALFRYRKARRAPRPSRYYDPNTHFYQAVRPEAQQLPIVPDAPTTKIPRFQGAPRTDTTLIRAINPRDYEG